MHIAFRADSSMELGSGHIYRCLSLALKLRQYSNLIPFFISKNTAGNFSQLVRNNGIEIIEIEDNLSEELDAKATLNIFENYNISCLIVDNYSLGAIYESQLKVRGTKVMVIDDLMNRKHNCDILLDQNFKQDYSLSYKSLVPEHCKRFLGPSYSLIREEFYKQRNKMTITPIDKISNVLVFFGGSDPDGETLRFIQQIHSLTQDFHFHILVSSGNKFISEINKYSSDNYTIHVNSQEIPQLMAQCEFYFGSGGSITWERMCIGLNGAIVIVAENQRLIAEELNNASLQYYWGWAHNFNYELLPEYLDKLTQKSLGEINSRTLKCMDLINEAKLQTLLEEIIKQ